MQDNQEKCKELAIRIYNLDEEVYKCVGSSLGRTFTGQKETTLRHLAALMYTKPDGHLLRSELALISNMARTIRDKSERRRLMIEYDSILNIRGRRFVFVVISMWCDVLNHIVDILFFILL